MTVSRPPADNPTESGKAVATRSSGPSIVSGAAWMVSMRWVIRLLGLVNIAVLARILSPDDFGLMAMAYMFTGLATNFSDLSLDQAILREARVNDKTYDIAWTVQIAVGIILAGVFALSAPAVAAFFKEPRATEILLILALQPLIAGFENIGVVKFRKDFAYRAEFAYWVGKRLVSILASILLAVAIGDYHALAYAGVASAAVTVAASFIVSPIRPRIRLTGADEIVSFSKWIVLTNGAIFCLQKTDGMVVGRIANAETLGSYAVASDLAMMPIQEILLPLDRVLIPSYAVKTSSRESLNRMFLRVLEFSIVAVSAIGTGLWCVAGDVVALILGAKWVSSVEYVQWLGVAACGFGMIWIVKDMMTVLRRERVGAYLQLIHLAVLAVAMAVVARHGDASSIAATRAAIAGVVAVAMVGGMLWWIGTGGWMVIFVAIRAAIAALIMGIVVAAARELDLGFLIANLALAIGVGALTYVGAVLVLWTIAGSPDSIERVAVEKAWAAIGRRAGPTQPH